MKTLYCSNCGCKHEYTVQKPKFCSSCGTPTTPIARASLAPKAAIETEEVDDSYVPAISKLEYDISVNKTKTTIGSLIKQQLSENPEESGSEERFVRPAVSEAERNRTPEEELQQSIEMCKSRRPTDDIGE
jgi:ribosomal protein L37E